MKYFHFLLVCIISVFGGVLPAHASLETALEAQVSRNENLRKMKVHNLVLAAEHNELRAVQYALQYDKVDVNAHDAELGGKTALMAASEKGHIEVVKYLVNEEAARIDVFDDEKKTNAKTALMYAVLNGHTEVVRFFAKTFMPRVFNQQNRNGDTALMMAARTGNTKIVEVLLQAGAVPEVRDKNGNTALIYAAAENKVGSAVLLLEFYEDKKDWHHLDKLIYARNIRGQNARDVAHSETVIKAWQKADHLLFEKLRSK